MGQWVMPGWEQGCSGGDEGEVNQHHRRHGSNSTGRVPVDVCQLSAGIAKPPSRLAQAWSRSTQQSLVQLCGQQGVTGGSAGERNRRVPNTS
jgi:hypothetical protein